MLLLQSSCFICGIGKDYLDKIPRGFESHCQKEHNFANYMFFLMHLINKPETEYTGQVRAFPTSQLLLTLHAHFRLRFRRRTCGSCISSAPGISSLLATVSGSNTKRSFRQEVTSSSSSSQPNIKFNSNFSTFLKVLQNSIT